MKKAQEKNIWSLEVLNIRDFAKDKHHTVDDSPYGGGPGMVMRPDVVHFAIEHGLSLLESPQETRLFYMSPRGQKLTQSMIQGLTEPLWIENNTSVSPMESFDICHSSGLSQKDDIFCSNSKNAIEMDTSSALKNGFCEKTGTFNDNYHIGLEEIQRKHKTLEWIILCGRFEGVDERVLQHWSFEHISIGDYILCGGELAAMVFLESCLRLVPGVLGNPQSFQEESFSQKESPLEGPLYTRPEKWLSYNIPDVLLSGHHGNIQKWRLNQGYLWTKNHRPDLLKKET